MPFSNRGPDNMAIPPLGDDTLTRDTYHVERRKTAQTVASSVGTIIAMAGLAITFLIQFGASIWWGATLSSDVRHLTDSVTQLHTQQYTKNDATRDIQRQDQNVQAVRDTLLILTQRVNKNEERLDAIARK